MSNITMTIDDDLLKKARKVAIDKGTSLTAMIRKYLKELVSRSESSREIARKKLLRLMEEEGCYMGEKKWTRDDLHRNLTRFQ